MSTEDEAINWEIFLWALYELGGDSQFIDVEDVYFRSFELAPQRFAWRTRSSLPDYKKCAKALRDAEARTPPLLVKTGDSLGRQLSVEGQQWISEHLSRLARVLRSGRVVREPRQRPLSRLLAEAERSEAYQAWKDQRVVPADRWRMAEMLHCSPDSAPVVWTTRLEALRSAAHAAEKSDLEHFLDEVTVVHPDWFQRRQ